MENAIYRSPNKSIKNMIRERRSIREYLNVSVERELVAELLNSAVWAPNHLKTEPWRFIMIDGESRLTMLEGMREYYSSTGFLDNLSETHLEKIKENFLKTPAHLVVVMREEETEKKWEEAFAATCALIQNFQLLAWEQGLGVVWKTNDHNASSLFKHRIGIQGSEKIVGILQLGYPASIPKSKPRKTAEELLTFL
ncbi:nitroreductase [Rossellomorea vietnamensis]|uniref:Putative NAD(P)H nitroreductase n=2 Tax=Rossellomorea TaxID=2837508 RepID=A0A5D4KBT9_9BACI|nr:MULTISPECIES: nitroreductase [Rossellomorea]TYR74339.1 nitroreductase [Rossellomorea vietnamensis]TYS77052.1 nitroreductase [Rossellomorea aquimaris]